MSKLRRQRHSKFKFEINILPLLDILLVLLLVSIIASPILVQDVEVELPSLSNPEVIGKNEDPSVIIEVSKIGEYAMLVGNDRLDQLRPNQILSDVQLRLKSNPKTIFLIGGEKSIPYNEIIKVINLLHRAGVKSVGLMTKPI